METTTGGYTEIKHRLESMSDEELVRQFQEGVEMAFNILRERHKENLKRYVQPFLKGPDANKKSEDLVADTFLRVHRNRHSYKPIATFKTWIYTIAGNLARSAYRKEKRRGTARLDAFNQDNERFGRGIEGSELAPDVMTDCSIQREEVHEALEQLPEEYRIVVLLRDVRGFSYAEIADYLEIPLGTVKSRISRGREKLQTLLSDVYAQSI